MTTQQLVVHDDPDVVKVTKKAIENAFGKSETFIVSASNIEEARAYLEPREREWSLMVIGNLVPASDTSGAHPCRSDPARTFIREVRARLDLPIIGLATSDDPAFDEVLKNWENTALVQGFAGLEENARALRNKTPIASALEVELMLKDDEVGIWIIKRRGQTDISETGSIRIDSSRFERLVNKSKMVGFSEEQFPTLMKDASQELHELLFAEGNRPLQKSFFKHLDAVGVENSRISFTMTQRRQQAMVELLRDDDNSPPKDFWMLRTSIVRQYPSSGGKRPLFIDRESRREDINCLIINADSKAGALESEKWKGTFAALPEIEAEANEIVSCLELARDQHLGIGKVELLDLSLAGADAKGTLLQALEGKTWHIVHFAGHGTLSKDAAPSPGLVLSAKHGVVIPFVELANKLRDTRFLFLSACRSASSAFITKAIEFSIPVVIGFQWTIADVDATRFAQYFYRCLFDQSRPTFKSLDRAMVASRQKAFDADPSGSTWASPVLLTQQRG